MGLSRNQRDRFFWTQRDSPPCATPVLMFQFGVKYTLDYLNVTHKS